MKRSVRRATWAITDQVLFAGSNFFLGLIAARWMVPETFGALSTALVVQTLTISAYESTFTEPMMVFGGGRYRERFRRYLGALLIGHLPGALLAALPVLFVALVLKQLGMTLVAAAFFGLGLSIPLVLLRYLARRACYAASHPEPATRGALVYAAAVGVGVFILSKGPELSSNGIFALMAAASLASAIATFPALKPSWPDAAMLIEIPSEHWRYARWSLASAFVRLVPDNIWYLILPVWWGLGGNAILRALSNLNLFIGHTMSALGMVLLPAMVNAYASGPERFRRVSIQAAVAFTTLSACYWLVLAAFGESLVLLMYDGKYLEHASLLALLGLSPVITSWGFVFGARAMSAERPDLIYRSNLAGLVAVVPGVILTYFFGVVGVICATLLVNLVVTATLIRLTRRDVAEWMR